MNYVRSHKHAIFTLPNSDKFQCWFFSSGDEVSSVTGGVILSSIVSMPALHKSAQRACSYGYCAYKLYWFAEEPHITSIGIRFFILLD